MQKLKEYLKKAKANQWTIDIGSLAVEYNLTIPQVKQCVNEIFNS